MGQFKHAKIISDIRELITLLKKYNFESTNAMELYRLEHLIGHNTDIFYNYDIADIVFNVSTSGMSAKPSVKKMAVLINTKYTLAPELSNTIDIFSSYALQIYIKGYKNEDDTSTDASNFFCWHLDKETNTEGNYIHPYYHFHAGGNYINGREIGELLMINSPRIPHPPMDIILSIHFVIQNFFNSKEFHKQKEILRDDNYILIIERAQKRTLDPYFSAIVNANHSVFSRQNLFPLYL